MPKKEKLEADSLGLKPIDDIDEYFDKLDEGDDDFLKFREKWEAISNFINDFEYLKGINNLTQQEIAEKTGTRQSAISRILRMKGNPSYNILRKMSKAVDGDLFISPMGEYSFTVPYELQNDVKQLAKEKSVSVDELIGDYLNLIVETEIHERENLEQTDDISHNENTLSLFALKISTDGNNIDLDHCREE